jgi:hypothetical protein
MTPKLLLRATVIMGIVASILSIAGTAKAQSWGYQPPMMGQFQGGYPRPMMGQFQGGYPRPVMGQFQGGYQNPGWGGYPRPVSYQPQTAPAVLPYLAPPRSYTAPQYTQPAAQPAQQQPAAQPAQWTSTLVPQWNNQVQPALNILGTICSFVCD